MDENSTKRESECDKCGYPNIDVNFQGECPSCGNFEKKVKLIGTDSLKISDKIESESKIEYTATNKKIQAISVVLIVISPIIGLFLNQVLGALIGLIIGLISYGISPYVSQKIIERNRYRY